jgi:Family of unknown function (DUF5681)
VLDRNQLTVAERQMAQGHGSSLENSSAEAAGPNAGDAEYVVGYRRPPKHARFQPGRSGNPRKRPRGARSLADMIRKIVGQLVTVTENGRTRRIPRLEAVLLRIVGEAMRGEARSLRLLLQLTERYGDSAQTNADREEQAAEDLEILRRYLPDLGAVDSQAADPGNDEEAENGRVS